MLFKIVKANSDDYVRFRNFETLEDILKYREEVHHDIIIGHNFHHNMNKDLREIAEQFYKNKDDEFWNNLNNCKYEILIHNDYIE